MIIYSGVALLMLYANASPLRPISINPFKYLDGILQTRQAGTFNGYDDSHAAFNGTYHCFKGGTWMAQSQLNGTLDQACTNNTDFDHDAGHFNFTLDPKGSNAHQLLLHRFRHCSTEHPFGVFSPECASPDQAYVNFQADFQSEMFANTDACRYAMRKIIEICHGKHQDTRGGWWQFIGDNTTYNVDPQGTGGDG